MSITAFLEVDHIDKVYPLKDGGEYIALKNIDLTIQKGEFVSLIGHSGCGKSTLLNMISGLEKPSMGGVILEGREITGPGPDRMMVFQNYSLLPWKTVRDNIALAVNRVFKDLPQSERRDIVEQHIDLVNLRHAADKRPKELSGGMKQRVAIARALAIRPKMLLLDEPFGALDALTRGNLQEQLMKICEETQITAVMVTHDVDEALLLSDRIVMLTNGPEAHIGQILTVPIPRPRKRLEVVNHPSYYSLRGEMIYFLNQQKRAKKRKTVAPVVVSRNGLEKVNLEIGFVPVTDCAPLMVAKEKGFFAKHGLEEVTLCREPNWKAIAEGIETGRLDAAHMLAGMPLAMTLGQDGKAPLPTLTALVLARNGNAITLSKALKEQGVRSLEDLKAEIQGRDQALNFGTVYPSSLQNLMLRYWLASAGVDPDTDVNMSTIPTAQLVANLSAGNIDGFCASEPWNNRAVKDDLGFVIATDLDIWASHPEKVLGVREDFSAQYPETHNALVKALLEACEYCDDRRNREEILKLLQRSQYVGPAAEFGRPGFIDPYDRGIDEEAPKNLFRFHQFHVDNANCPGRVEGLWVLTQLARWGVTPFPRNWIEILERVRRVDLYGRAARELGLPDNEGNRSPFELFDGKVFNPDDPIGYLNSLEIKREIEVKEILIDAPKENPLKLVA